MIAPQLMIPAAQYLRMSTDQQRLSLAYQAAAIQRYADTHGFRIVQTYADPGRSGLTLKRRTGLAQLLRDVVTGSQSFKAILVYDVSRWGRFQDTDESAHYEFVCKSAGTPVYYCAETFRNNASPPAAIMKTLKRVMAAEYSRELSERMRRTKKILTQRGFRAGGIAGYGLRRMLVSYDGLPKHILPPGEVMGFASGRVILVPGPAREVARVREIYRLTICEKKSAKAIARDFNRKGLKCLGARWNDQRILEILRNPKYAGWAVWGRTVGPLGKRPIAVPQSQWTINAHAFQPIVDQETFETAQKVLNNRTRYKSKDEMLDGLRLLLKREGRLSEELINLSREIPLAGAYLRRFGGLRQAYALIGYRESANREGALRMRRRHRRIEQALLRRISRIFGAEVTLLRERAACRRVLCFRDGLKISVLISQYVTFGNGTVRWGVKVNRFERDYPSLICRCNASNSSFMDFHVVPKIETQCKNRFLIRENDPWLRTGKCLSDLSQLRSAAERLISINSTRR
jgi:DNA invertase Pin-like site-specific DNA recombinase